MPAKAPGPESIWAALGLGRGAHRPWHRRSRRPRADARLQERDIPLEICITSNLVTGRGEAHGRSPGAAAVRCGRADHAEYRRPGHVRLHAGRASTAWRRDNSASASRSCAGLRRMVSGIAGAVPALELIWHLEFTESSTLFGSLLSLTASDGFNYWSNPQLYTSLGLLELRAGKSVIATLSHPRCVQVMEMAAILLPSPTMQTRSTPQAMRAPGGKSSGFPIASHCRMAGGNRPSQLQDFDRRAAVHRYQVLCGDCFASLPAWLEQWQRRMSHCPISTELRGFQRHRGRRNLLSGERFVRW